MTAFPPHLDGVLPEDDRRTSPHSGFTRAHWEATADHLLLSLVPFRTPGGARFNLPGPVSQQGVATDGIEAFARTFLLAAFRHLGADGDPHAHLDRYLEGVVAGTRAIGSDDPDSWPVVGHIGRTAQPHAEAASIALSLNLTRDDTWDRLSTTEQDRVADWFHATCRMEPASNNWYLFPTTIASFLERVDRGDETTAMILRRGLRLADRWYRGEGWYSDGEGEAFDHYVGWAMHFYPMFHARLHEDRDLEQRLGERLHAFLETFGQMFDRNGSPVYIGRSMTYRTATSAAVAMGAWTGYTPWSPGQNRRLLSSTLRYFLERGAVDRRGLFTLGWHTPHVPSLQRYSGPGSPYWASKGFLGLALPAEHPLWQEPEAALPGDADDAVLPVPPAGLMIQRTKDDGLVRVHNHGSDHLKTDHADAGATDPLYARFAYSTRTGPTALHNVEDNDFQLRIRGCWSVRRRIHAVATGTNWAASWHHPRFPQYSPWEASPEAAGGPVLPSARIESLALARGADEIRIHRLVGVPEDLEVRMSGWAVAADHPDLLTTDVVGGAPTVTRPDDLLVSVIAPLHGFDTGSEAVAPWGTAYGEWAVVPQLHGRSREDAVYVAGVRLTGSPVDGGRPGVDVAGPRVSVRWPDGEEQHVDLDEVFGPTSSDRR